MKINHQEERNMKKILAFALALMLAIPALAFADGNDVQIVVQGAAEVIAYGTAVKFV